MSAAPTRGVRTVKLESEPYPKRRIDAMTGVMMLLTLAALSGTAWLRLRPSPGASGATVGAEAPPLKLIDPETSEPIVLAGLKDKVAWVVFWSAGSESGRTCLAELETATSRLRMHRRFALVAAASAEGDDAAKIRSAARAAGFQQPVYLAGEETRRRFHAEACDPPLHVLIDAGSGILAMARGDGRPTIDRIAELARDRLDEIDPEGQTRFAVAIAGLPRRVGPSDPLGAGHGMHPCGDRRNLID